MTTAARIALGVLATIAVALGLLLVGPSAANAGDATFVSAGGAATSDRSGIDGDTRRCATRREVWLIGKNLSRPDLERRWEVRGLGHPVVAGIVGAAIAYPLCDEPDRYAFAQYGHPMVFGIGKTSDLARG